MLLEFLKTNPETLPSDWFSSLSASNWESLVEEANRSGYAPMLYRRLASLEEGYVPTDILQQLRKNASMAALRNKIHFNELTRLLHRLQEAEIPVIFLKGIHLAKFVYDDITLRPMVDVDLLVKHEDLTKLPGLLNEMGYSPERPYWLEDELSTSHHLPPFQKPGKSAFEIHWTIVHPDLHAQVDIDGLWARARLVNYEGMPVRLLSPEDHLLHLCLHCCQDHFKLGLRSLQDILKIVDFYRDGFDWNEFVQRTFNWRASRCVYLTLLLARDLVGCEIPGHILESLQPDDYQPEVIDWAVGQLLTAPEYTPKLLIRMSGDQTWKAKLIAFWRGVVPPRSEISQTYIIPPDSRRIFLYYFVHLKDLVVKGLMKGGQLLRQGKSVAARAEREASLIKWLEID